MSQAQLALEPEIESPKQSSGPNGIQARAPASPRKKIWIDLENSPHVPFFKPIIKELEENGYSILLTARDCFQVCDLADLSGLRYQRIGRHYGKHTIAKLGGLAIRVAQLVPTVLREKPILAISHGSRSLFVLASILRIPTITIFDYEHARWVKPIGNHWVIVPEVMPEAAVLAIGIRKDHILRYPGIKEDVYVPSFHPDNSIRQLLNVGDHDVVITIRPPATEAHYRSAESDKLMSAVFELIGRSANVKAILLPRTPAQESELRAQWPALFKGRKVVVPEHVVNGLDLIWLSDLVISGGGTMNREAAALGVPVYSIFRGTPCAVDKHLAQAGRLTLLESPQDVGEKVKLERRKMNGQPHVELRRTLQSVVDHIDAVSKTTC
jgi:hypothetical protein